MAGGVRDIYAVSRLETVEIAEDSRTPDAVEVAIDDRLSGCSGLRAGLQPAGVPDVARDVHETAGGDADGFHNGVDAQRGNADAIGHDRTGRRLERGSEGAKLGLHRRDRLTEELDVRWASRHQAGLRPRRQRRPGRP